MPPDQAEAGSLGEFVADQIEKLRPRLLDLSRRNPLLSAPISNRSHALVRVVDEVPTVLFEKLVSGGMCFKPLPPLEEDPLDELSREFQNTLIDARLTDEHYLTSLDEIDDDAEDAAERLIKIERDLKDRIREALEYSPRQTRGDLSLVQHAKNNHIRPSYDLPTEIAEDEDNRHLDDDIQTLLLPDLFERRLNTIGTKCRTWLQETGISVLHVAFGFLEWAETDTARSSFAPLLLMPALLEKKRTAAGPEYKVTGDENVENNVVLGEKLRIDFALDLPQYEPGTPIEAYFQLVADAAPKGRKWRVRRQVAIGVFPSARMAMYHDLDTKKWPFGDNQVALDLFGGNPSSAGSSPFADDYPVDEPEVEIKVPLLVMDADSSQFSAMVDALDGKNLAVEGPPGTGKSQTIVNTIASAIVSGKKVLFVAEKMAALDVVRSRLEAAGVGEFVLPLLANRSGREQIIRSIRGRMELSRSRRTSELNEKIERYRADRAEIAQYVTSVGAQHGETGLRVYDVLGRQIACRETLEKWPVELQRHEWPPCTRITDARLKELSDLAEDIDEAASNCAPQADHWRNIGIGDIDPFCPSSYKLEHSRA